MRKTVFTCDHCGKKIDELHDYTEIEIDDFDFLFQTDLCHKCFHELNDIVMQYCKKERGIL